MPHSAVDVEGRLVEQTGEVTKGIANAEIWVSDKKHGTDTDGHFAFKVLLSDEEIKLDIRPVGYKILKPLGGVLQVDPNTTVLRIEIFVISESADSRLLEKANDLEKRLATSEKEKNLSRRQLHKINQALIDTLAHFDREQGIQLQQIEDIKSELETATVQNEDLKLELEEKEAQIESLNEQVDLLTDQLYEALEEKFLRQQEYYNNISADLNNFLIRSKDAYDLLPKIKYYFPMNYIREREEIYQNKTKLYSDSFTKLNDQRDDYLKAVERYWENPEIDQQLTETFDFILDQFHKMHFKPSFDNLEAHLYRNKKKKAAKTGAAAADDLKPKIEQLETSIQQAIATLEGYL